MSHIELERITLDVGAGTLVSHAPVVMTPIGGYSLHDCSDPGQVEVSNCIYPLNLASPDGKFGLTVHSREPGGTVTVTTA